MEYRTYTSNERWETTATTRTTNMPIWICGPLCLVCDGENVVKRDEPGIVAWNSNGPVYGTVRRDVCLDCERRQKEVIGRVLEGANQ